MQGAKCVCAKGTCLLVGTQRGPLLPRVRGRGRPEEPDERGAIWAKPEMTVRGLPGAAPGAVSLLAGQVSYLEPSLF